MSSIETIIGGASVNPIENWQSVSINASFLSEREDIDAQASIETSEVNLVNEAAKQVRDYIAGGLNGSTNGIFESPTFIMNFIDGLNSINVYDGYLDLAGTYEEINPTRVKTKLTGRELAPSFLEQASGVTYGYLESINAIGQNDYVDITYVRQQPFNFVEFALVALANYAMLQQLADAIRVVSTQAANIVGHISGGISGGVAGAIVTAALIIINLAYAALMIIYLTSLMQDLITFLVALKKTHRGIKLGTLLSVGASYLGYSFQSSLSILDELFYWPSKTKDGILSNFTNNDSGIPRNVDVGYTIGEAFQLAMDLFRAKLRVTQGPNGLEIHLEPLINDSYWVQNSTYVLPSVLDERKVYNTDELIANKIISFATDETDQWTTLDYTGTAYEIVTRPISFTNQRQVGIKGLQETRFGVALAARKNGLTDFEEAVRILAGVVDSVVNFFGGNSTLAQSITDKIGMPKLSTEYNGVAKLIRLDASGKLPLNHRSLWGAKFLYDNYHLHDSFVINDRNQYRLVKQLVTGFGLSDFNALVDNNYFEDQAGNRCWAESIKWTLGGDKAELTYRVREKYTTNLQEVYREAA